MSKISFASENYMGAHEAFIEAIKVANNNPEPSYGNDSYTEKVTRSFSEHFERDTGVLFAFNGTGANNLALSCLVKPYSAVYCADTAHIYVDESTAPEAFLACRIYPVPSKDGKIIIEDLERKLARIGDVHHPQAAVISISQPTEYGTIYSVDEMNAFGELARKYSLKLHVDGARFFNAVAASGKSFYELTSHVDVLTLGGTKNGMLFGEAVLFFNKSDANPFLLKRSMQLASKMRFISCQFLTMFENMLWNKLATHANNLAMHFSKGLRDIPGIELTRPVETNAVFARMPPDLYRWLQSEVSFYLWNEQQQESRFMFSFNNTEQEVEKILKHLKNKNNSN